MATMMRITVPLHTAWDLAWVDAVAVANAMGQRMDLRLRSTVHILTRRSSWFMALSRLKSTRTKSSTSSACMGM